MDIQKILAPLLVSILLASCAAQPPAAPPPDLNDAGVVKSLTAFSSDPYTKGSFFISPELSPVRYENLYLRAIRHEAKPWVYQLFVRAQYSREWRFYDSAFDLDGNKLVFFSIDRKTDSCKYGCDFYETMSITVSREYLVQRRNRGLNIKISGKTGDRIVYVSPGYVAGFLDAVN